MNFTRKSRTTSLILTVLFGPLGLLYSSIVGGILLTLIAVVSAPTVVGPIICWLLAIALGDDRTHRHNKSLEKLESMLARG